MGYKRLFGLILLLVILSQSAGVGQEKPPANGTAAVATPDKQLEINKNSLFNDPSEQIRIDAATLLLFNEKPQARKILIDALKQTENTAARVAVCKALGLTRGTDKLISNKKDFIQPLLEILTTADTGLAKLVAEITSIYKYDEISAALEKIVADTSLAAKARSNAINGLKRPDKRAIFLLIKLLDDPDKEVATAAGNVLIELGLPLVNKSPDMRRQIVEELERKGPDEFLRERLIQQDKDIERLKNESVFWREKYLVLLDKYYANGIKEDAAKAAFLSEHLGNTEAIVKLWALEKVHQWRLGTNPKLPVQLGPILVNLISDQNGDIRLKTAEVLSVMVEVNSADKLLAQLKSEGDNEIKLKMFIALGGTCYYALSPNAEFKITPEIRKQALGLACEYLTKPDSRGAQNGAKVMKKLLERDGLSANEVKGYLDLLGKRYSKAKEEGDGALRGELLNAMGGLCAESVYKAKAAELFGGMFKEAVSDETDLVREAALDGLIYIDTTNALNIFRKALVNDPSSNIRAKGIDLAGKVGGAEDLEWLAKKTGTAGEGDLAWRTMLKILKRPETKAAVFSEWLPKFEGANGVTKLSQEQMIPFLEIAETKAESEKNAALLETVRGKLAELYTSKGEFEQAAKRCGLLLSNAADDKKGAFRVKLLDVYLVWSKMDLAASLVANRLSVSDLDSNAAIVKSIDNYLSKPPEGVDPKKLLDELVKIQPAEARVKWAEQLKQWTERLKPAPKPPAPKPEEASKPEPTPATDKPEEASN